MMEQNMQRLSDDLDWFCDKFDYRNKDADWRTSKDALPRGMQKAACRLPGRRTVYYGQIKSKPAGCTEIICTACMAFYYTKHVFNQKRYHIMNSSSFSFKTFSRYPS